jgi:hypothetical protein
MTARSSRRLVVEPVHLEQARASMDWRQVAPAMFQLGTRLGSYWKGSNGWWATRRGYEGIHGPFETGDEARAWAEAPKVAAAAQRTAARALRRRWQTWAGLQDTEQVLSSGQVWRRRDRRYERHEILLVKQAPGGKWICFCRVAPNKHWGSSRPVTRSSANLTILYALQKAGERIPDHKPR